MLRVLLLEDSRIDETILAAHLRKRSFLCELRRVDAREPFVDALRDWCPDVILSDYKVPGFGGEDALVVARERLPDVPFLFVSGALGEEAAVDLLKRGATDYVLKDRLDRLVPSIDRALREAREKDALRKAQEQLTERERTLSTLMRNLPGMAFRARMGRPWLLDFASEGCLSLTGYEPAAFRPEAGVGFESIMHPDDVARVALEADQALERGHQLTSTYRITTLAGEERWLWVRAVMHREPDGQTVMEGFVTDITAQKAAEAEVSRRIEFEQQLIGIVSHDLKNPLNAILIGATTLLKREATNETSTKLARRILAVTERATRMINDLLDFTQVRLGGGLPVAPTDIDLRETTAEVLEEFEASHPERVLVLSAPPTIHASVDPGRFSQVVANLVQNAIAYSSPETGVTVSLADMGDDVVLEVHNHGDPIPVEKQADIFQPMRRGNGLVSNSTRSIGLGLFIVANIAQAHGGMVSVRSSPADGTTFTVRLPRTPQRKLT